MDHSKSPISELLKNQESFKKSYRDVLSLNSDESNYLNSLEGWEIKTVEYTLGYSHKTTLMNVLKIENLVFYKPIDKVENAEFERFFGFGCHCNDFSQDKIGFSYGEIFN